MTDGFDDQMGENASLLQRLSPSPLSRRRVLLGGGLGALSLVAAACGTEQEEPAATGEPTTSTAAREQGGDASGESAIAMTAASLEVLAVNTYAAALDANLDYPPAVAEFATVAREHHQAHLDAWNALLARLGQPEVTHPPPDLQESVNRQLSEAGDAAAVAELALMLEQTAADTYFAAIPQLANDEAVSLAATIYPVDMQHSAILRYVLGEYPVPNAFADAENALSL